ncbi:hypothetical protein QEO94_07260 [Kingella negevensis]|uniref:hypothetical protein n=1 Tax=Kingella negevensis TaxID=1522312 RepID=UPI002542F899|nr:hypothetical protein [Kingella negevensis]WII92442.1 hypothetical protein QEO94_07260 [Kingella negevensis]
MDAQPQFKQHKKSPLPFVGQKRNFIQHIVPILQQNIPNQGAGWTIIDIFGGSGLLAHTAKRALPKARVIYNDFDGFAQRIAQIPQTEQLRQQLYTFFADLPRNKAIPPQYKDKAIAIIQNASYVDVQTLAGWLLFSSAQASSLKELLEARWYSGIPKNPYQPAEDYLQGLEIRSQSFTELLPEFANQPQTLLLLDPPYVSTAQGAYANKNYFGMTQFLQLVDQLRAPYIFFSSTRSELLDYVYYVTTHQVHNWQAWDGCQKVSIQERLNYHVTYEDNLLYKFE